MRTVRVKSECHKLKREAYLMFSVIEAAVFDSPENGIIGLLERCSLCAGTGADACSDCPAIAEFTNRTVSLK